MCVGVESSGTPGMLTISIWSFTHLHTSGPYHFDFCCASGGHYGGLRDISGWCVISIYYPSEKFLSSVFSVKVRVLGIRVTK